MVLRQIRRFVESEIAVRTEDPEERRSASHAFAANGSTLNVLLTIVPIHNPFDLASKSFNNALNYFGSGSQIRHAVRLIADCRAIEIVETMEHRVPALPSTTAHCPAHTDPHHST